MTRAGYAEPFVLEWQDPLWQVCSTDAGFHNVHDVDFEGDHWKAEADDVSGEDFEVHVDSYSGRIVHVEDD